MYWDKSEDEDLTILECDSDLNLRFVKDGYPDGETYIPSAIFDDIDNMKEDGAE